MSCMKTKVLIPIILFILAASAAAVWFTAKGGENGLSVTKPGGGTSTIVEDKEKVNDDGLLYRVKLNDNTVSFLLPKNFEVYPGIATKRFPFGEVKVFSIETSEIIETGGLVDPPLQILLLEENVSSEKVDEIEHFFTNDETVVNRSNTSVGEYSAKFIHLENQGWSINEQKKLVLLEKNSRIHAIALLTPRNDEDLVLVNALNEILSSLKF